MVKIKESMRQIRTKKWQKFLKDNNACKEGNEFAKDMEPDEFWQKCKNPRWMFWVLKRISYKIEKEAYVKIAIECAESVSQLCTNIKETNNAINAAKEWVKNPCKETEKAARIAANAALSSCKIYDSYPNPEAHKASYSAYKAANAVAYGIPIYYANEAASYALRDDGENVSNIIRKYIPKLTEGML